MDINKSNRRRSNRSSNGPLSGSFVRKQSFNLASSVASGSPRSTPRESFSGVRNFNSPLNDAGPLDDMSSAVSTYSVDIDNPDPETVRVVARHLVQDGEYLESAVDDGTGSPADDKFSSLRLQGGDITRQIYNWQREHGGEDGQIKRGRSRSFDMPRNVETGPMGDPLDVKQMKAPGGFRRDYITHKTINPQASFSRYNGTDEESGPGGTPEYRPTVFTRNFIEFLSLYGHFAGEELEEDEDSDDFIGEPDFSEQSALLASSPRRTQKLSQQAKGQASVAESVMLLLKSFVGTGVLFLPRAFYNGGLLFSAVVLILVSVISYWCFLLLIASKQYTKVTSFGDIGGALYGNWARQLILTSIVMSQIGFASAYIVFVSENLQAFFHNVAEGSHPVTISTLICVQLVVFLPLSMIRDIAKLGFTALIADFFILLGLLYLYGWGGTTVLTDGVADVAMFNKDNWTLFIGTAIFTYEGIGLIIPIQESMREPRKFGSVLAGVMVGITVVFISIGALLYMACGSSVETVILLNLPKGSRAVNTIQLLYSLAILLSTPLQLFPAIRILENWIFVRSGKFSRKVKWEKNLFRFFLVFLSGVVAYVGANDLDKFVALVGSFACVPLVYIYPPMLHMQVVDAHSIAWYADHIMMICGFFVMIYTSWTTLSSWVS